MSDLSQIYSHIDELVLASKKEFLSINDASLFTSLAVSTLYKMVHRKQIPYIKKNGKLIFSRNRLREWLDASAVKTDYEVESEAIKRNLR